MDKLKVLLIFVVCSSGSFFCMGQQRNDLHALAPSTSNTIKTLVEVPAIDAKKIQRVAFSEHRNELQFLFSSLFLGYKTFLSSQDQPDRCAFTPSCSEYGLYAVRRHGIIGGVIITFDRLSRCNNYAHKGGYPVDEATGKYLDAP
jgi:uncharacterized protein